MASLTNVDGVHKLTPTQAGMLYECVAADDPHLYFEQYRADIVGPIDLDRFSAAWQSVAARHEALRSMIIWEGVEEPLQVVRSSVDVPINVIHSPTRTCDEIAGSNRNSGISLTNAPLMHVTLVQTGTNEWHLIWDFHHIIADGWSAALVVEDVLNAYDNDLGAPVAQFSDYLAWLHAQDSNRGNQYWKELLAGSDGPARFALGVATDSTAKYRARRFEYRFDSTTTELLTQTARDLRVTPNVILQGACALALSLFSNSEDVVYGVTSSGRSGSIDGLEEAVGMFLKTMPFRLNVAQDVPASKFLLSLQDQQLSAEEFSYVGLPDALANTDSSRGSAPFDLVWIYENFPRSENTHSLDLRPQSVFEQTNYPITLMVGQDGAELLVVALYNGSVFADSMAENFVDHLATAAKAIANNLSVPVNQLDIVPDSERQDLLAISQGPELAFDTTGLVHELFDAQAFRTPHATALNDGGRTITFNQLRTQSNALAHQLVERGVSVGETVGVCIERSIESVVAMLAAMKAGAAYVPLEPSHPKARLDRIISLSGTQVVLTNADADHIESVEQAPIVLMPSTQPMLVTFTSGTTGEPKGVPVHHQGVLNRLHWQWSEFGDSPDEVACHKTSFTFVDHLWELWGALCCGRRVVVANDALVSDLDRLLKTLARERVTQISLVPSLLDAICEVFGGDGKLAKALPLLKTWSVSGEALRSETAHRFYATAPHADLINLYGMSEASQDCTFYPVPRLGHAAISAGRPISNMTVHVLGPNLMPTPLGIVGEVCLSGTGVSEGYLNAEDSSSNSFIENPFDDSGSLLYRTGDIGWRNRKGNLMLVGRRDSQLKVRGVRIEPAEVERALLDLPGITEALVMERNSQLVAFVAPSSVDPVAARIQISKVLPATMLPDVVHPLTELPKTPSGKRDRRALAELTIISAADEPIEPATDETVRSMVAIWEQVFGNEIRPDDDFFAVGGHSLLALKLFSVIKRELGASLPLSLLASAPTPRLLAAEISKPAEDGEFRHLVNLGSTENAPNIFCVHGAGGNVLNFMDLAQALNPAFNLVGIVASGANGHGRMAATRKEMINSYVAEIQAYQPEGPLTLAGFSNGGLAAYALAARLIEDGRKVESLVLLDTFHSSCTVKKFGRDRHLENLKAAPFSYAKQTVRQRLDRQRMALMRKHDFIGQIWEAELAEDKLILNMVRLWNDYEPRPINTRVILCSADTPKEIWDHVGPNRQWPEYLGVETVVVPGDHHNHVIGDNAKHLGEIIIATLSNNLPEF